MRKSSRHRKFRPRRFLLVLLLLFAISFSASGGLHIFSPRTWQSIGDFLPADTASTEQETSPAGRLKRLVFLRRAVNAKIQREEYVPLDKISPDLQHAVVAVEDRRFYEHHGLDFAGVIRAALVNLQYGSIEEGASTITQQLVKNLFLSHEQTFGRKAEEVLLALDMEANYSKDEILALYLNTIYYGSGYYGIRAAADGYFGKAPKDLALPEAAMLAGVPNAPSVYSPYVDFLMAKKRQMVVLDAMQEAGYIDSALAEEAKITPLTFVQTKE